MLRSAEVYDKIASEYGKVIESSNFSWKDYDVVCGVCFITTDSGVTINEKMFVSWKNKTYPIWVNEESLQWKLHEDDDETMHDSETDSDINSINDENQDNENFEFVGEHPANNANSGQGGKDKGQDEVEKAGALNGGSNKVLNAMTDGISNVEHDNDDSSNDVANNIDAGPILTDTLNVSFNPPEQNPTNPNLVENNIGVFRASSISMSVPTHLDLKVDLALLLTESAAKTR